MTAANWTEAESERARKIWLDYQRRHDVSQITGHTVGIEPVTGAIWFGDSIQEVVAQRDAEGNSSPLYFVRVGSETYYRKGGRN